MTILTRNLSKDIILGLAQALHCDEITTNIPRYFIGLSRNSFFTVSGVAYFMGSCAGSIPLPLNYLEQLNHPEERKGMKPRSSLDKSEKPRLRVCQKPGTAFKLGRALLS